MILKQVVQNVDWRNFMAFMSECVLSYHSSKENKTVRHRKFSPLQPFELAPSTRNFYAMNFITYPSDFQGHTGIWVVFEQFSKMTLIIPLHLGKTGLQDAAPIFIWEVWWPQGLTTRIIINRNTQFCSSFWLSLCKPLNMIWKISTACHTLNDIQTECTNKIRNSCIQPFYV